MIGNDLKERTRKFSLRVNKMTEAIPRTIAGQALTNQIFRSATAVAANYRAACRPKSARDFINKLKIVEEELDETLFWLEFITDAEIFPNGKLDPLKEETAELLKIIAKSLVTARRNQRMQKENGKTASA
jgi:four helix bundle protein